MVRGIKMFVQKLVSTIINLKSMPRYSFVECSLRFPNINQSTEGTLNCVDNIRRFTGQIVEVFGTEITSCEITSKGIPSDQYITGLKCSADRTFRNRAHKIRKGIIKSILNSACLFRTWRV